MVRKMRASILVLGPMLARMGEATVSLPGGARSATARSICTCKALEALGAEIEMATGYVRAQAPDGGLPGGAIQLPGRVGRRDRECADGGSARQGQQLAHNAAREPEIVDLCNMLVAMGAQIEGIGTSDLTIHGVPRLHGATYQVMADRIEAGSYACAAAITGGEVTLQGAKFSEMDATVQALRDAGVSVEPVAGGIHVATDGPLKAVTLSTAPYPGFATDMQAQLMALLCMAEGSSVLTETIFENRYMHVPELNRMGAHIETSGRTAVVHGVQAAHRRRSDGDRSARLDEPGDRGAGRAGRDAGPPALPSRPGLRAARRKSSRCWARRCGRVGEDRTRTFPAPRV